MQHAIYKGFVIHNRFSPVKHKFKYNIQLFFLDLDTLDSAFCGLPFISLNRFNLLSFYRKSYLPSASGRSIKEEVSYHILKHGYSQLPDKVYILTNLAHLGYCYNPVTFYYCYNQSGKLLYVLAEVNNTPWNERHVYVEQFSDKPISKMQFQKNFHVSPFLPIDMRYTWIMNQPGEEIKIAMTCECDQAEFHATMKLVKQPLNLRNSLLSLITNPLATFVIIFRIYWQALFLFIKRCPFFPHPHRNKV